MNLKSLEKLATILAAKKRLEESRYRAILRSQMSCRKEATALMTRAQQSLAGSENSDSGEELKNCAAYFSLLSTRAEEKTKAADYLEGNLQSQRNCLRTALNEEQTIDVLSERERQLERKARLEREEQSLEAFRLHHRAR